MRSPLLPRLLLASAFFTFIQAEICRTAPGGILPIKEDCVEFVDALVEISRLPSQRQPKTWGRELPSNPAALTEHLPKLYWIRYRPHGPTTCGAQLDVDPRQPLAVETFGLIDVANAAEGILDLCLSRRGMLGMQRLGSGRRVEAKLVRVDNGNFLNKGRGVLQKLGTTRRGGVIWSWEVGNGTGIARSQS
ncbi:MAG: hypothetical protein HETSPECPRED_009300 [Heterodermia speciosa]|uniref:Uncharacterized protein n=1 Tax=Heterodermia speciosa TaxID=116794 RepID=A0A8H3IUX8_9LECA|nr:MAG: hypothetical protein HETSPECPRED_009300 [Heterodermia speciosa]